MARADDAAARWSCAAGGVRRGVLPERFRHFLDHRRLYVLVGRESRGNLTYLAPVTRVEGVKQELMIPLESSVAPVVHSHEVADVLLRGELCVAARLDEPRSYQMRRCAIAVKQAQKGLRERELGVVGVLVQHDLRIASDVSRVPCDAGVHELLDRWHSRLRDVLDDQGAQVGVVFWILHESRCRLS